MCANSEIFRTPNMEQQKENINASMIVKPEQIVFVEKGHH